MRPSTVAPINTCWAVGASGNPIGFCCQIMCARKFLRNFLVLANAKRGDYQPITKIHTCRAYGRRRAGQPDDVALSKGILQSTGEVHEGRTSPLVHPGSPDSQGQDQPQSCLAAGPCLARTSAGPPYGFDPAGHGHPKNLPSPFATRWFVRLWDFLTPPSQDVKAYGFQLKARPPLAAIDGHEISDKSFLGLDKTLRDQFLSFNVGIGEITESTNDEITVLFARLQMGMPLNPAELRNADLGPMRNIIQLMATSHEFFANTPMRDERTKHFDYASFAFATAMGIGKMDMKAPDLRELQHKCNGLPAEELMQLSSKVGEALNVLSEVDQRTAYPVTRKWIFVDLLGLIMLYHDSGKAVDVDKFTAAYDVFENRRRAYTSHMDKLLDSKRKDAETLDRQLYDYLAAFRTEGAKAASLLARQNALKRFFRNVEVK
jgi:hypothetical protein